jgi:nitrate reductase cytochrome c-type subunit
LELASGIIKDQRKGAHKEEEEEDEEEDEVAEEDDEEEEEREDESQVPNPPIIPDAPKRFNLATDLGNLIIIHTVHIHIRTSRSTFLTYIVYIAFFTVLTYT